MTTTADLVDILGNNQDVSGILGNPNVSWEPGVGFSYTPDAGNTAGWGGGGAPAAPADSAMDQVQSTLTAQGNVPTGAPAGMQNILGNSDIVWVPGVGYQLASQASGAPGAMNTVGWGSALPGGPATQTLPNKTVAGGTGPSVVTPPGTPGALNAPYGSDFYAPLLQLIAQMLGVGENKRQFDATSLAELQSKPYSAAELAARRVGMGMSAFGNNAQSVRDLIANPTQAGGGGVASFGDGTSFSIPDTLSGLDLSQLKGTPNTQGVIESFAGQAGNPDIIARSLKALLPAGFGGSGTGLQ